MPKKLLISKQYAKTGHFDYELRTLVNVKFICQTLPMSESIARQIIPKASHSFICNTISVAKGRKLFQ